MIPPATGERRWVLHLELWHGDGLAMPAEVIERRRLEFDDGRAAYDAVAHYARSGWHVDLEVYAWDGSIWRSSLTGGAQ